MVLCSKRTVADHRAAQGVKLALQPQGLEACKGGANAQVDLLELRWCKSQSNMELPNLPGVHRLGVVLVGFREGVASPRKVSVKTVRSPVRQWWRPRPVCKSREVGSEHLQPGVGFPTDVDDLSACLSEMDAGRGSNRLGQHLKSDVLSLTITV